MIVDLTDTTAAKIAAAFVEARHRAGVPAVGMVGTLVIITGEADHYDALRAAQESSREHPARIIVGILRPGKGVARLDAEVRFMGDSGPGETAVLRLHGELADHAQSVVLPLLLPDAPVLVWWPSGGPPNPGKDPVGRLAQRRISDSASDDDPVAALRTRGLAYTPGDTDLAWTRITSWRTLLAATLDQPYSPITGAEVGCEAGSPSAELLAVWLEQCLDVEVRRVVTDGPGITSAVIDTTDGPLALTRPDGRIAALSRPGQPDREVSLQARDTVSIISEEMRRLDPDDVYGSVIDRLCKSGASAPSS